MDATERWSLPVKQLRSRQTREKLIAAGFKLLRRKPFDELHVADIARAAGCSVGAFYVRFRDKDQYFLALMERFRSRRLEEVEAFYGSASLRTLARDVIRFELGLIGEHLNLWRAALLRGATDPVFWEEMRTLGLRATNSFLEFYARHRGRALTPEEARNIRFAFQMIRGTLNNTILNRPGPLHSDDPEFLRESERAFGLIAGMPPEEPAR